MQHTKRSSLFLMELILAITLFSIASAFCVQIFVKSHTLSLQSTELNHAVHIATSVAEEFRHSNLSSEIRYFDKDWVVCDEKAAVYTLELDVESEKTPLKANINVLTDTSSIYHLEVLKNANTEVLQ